MTPPRVLSLFSGIGGIDLGLERAGMRVVGQCEIDPFCAEVLTKHWPGIWRHDDVSTLDGTAWLGHVDVVAGGFPCTDISVAGKGAGLGSEEDPTARSGLWFEMRRIIGECRPRWALIENVPALKTRGSDRVLSDLEALGYAAWPVVVGAWAVGATHKRDRVWIVARLANADRRGNDEELQVHLRPRGFREASRDVAGPSPLLENADSNPIRVEQQRDLRRSQRIQNEGQPLVGESGEGAVAYAPPRGLGIDWGSFRQARHADECSEAPMAHAGHSALQEPQSNDIQREQWSPQRRGQLISSGVGAGSPPSGGGNASRDVRHTAAPENAGDSGRSVAHAEPNGCGQGSRYEGNAQGSRGWRAELGGSDPRVEHPDSAGRHEELNASAESAIARFDTGAVAWPARPGEEQFDWEEPRLTQRALGGATDGIPPGLVRLAKRSNREALRAYGNSVVPQVVEAIGRWIVSRT